MAIHIAPGVYSEIIVKNRSVEILPGTIGLFIFASEKGEANKLVKGNLKKLIDDFGMPNVQKYGQAQLNAYEFLNTSGNAWLMRVVPTPEMDPNYDTNPDLDFPAKYAHVVFGYVTITDDNGNKKYGMFPIYVNQDDAGTVSNVFEQINGNKYVSQFSTQTFVLPDGDLIKTNAYELIRNQITFTTEQVDALNNDTALKSLWFPATYDVDTYLNAYYDGFIVPDTYTPFMIIMGKGPGKYYNNISVSFVKDPFEPDVYIMSVKLSTAAATSTVETFRVSFDPDKTDASGESLYIENVLDTYSKYIKVLLNKDVVFSLMNTIDPATENSPTPKSVFEVMFELTWFRTDTDTGVCSERAIVPLKYGSDGKLFKEDGTLDYTVYEVCLLQAFKGILDSNITNKDETDFSLIYDANFPISVKQAIVELCENRRDCFAVLDFPITTDVYNAATISKTTLAWLNSMFASIYLPFSKIKDEFTGTVRKVAPSYHLSYIYPRVDRNRNIWDAPAGLRKAILEKCSELMFNPSREEELEILTLNRINPIIKKSGSYVVFGNRTTLKTNSPLGDINVVRTILYIDRMLTNFCNSYIFENNTPTTWTQVKNAINEMLSDIKAKGGLYDFSIDVGATDYEIKQRRMHVNVYLKPVRAIEVITLTYTIE